MWPIKKLTNYYANTLPITQNKLIGLIFPDKLIFTGEAYKTTKINLVFSLICNVDKGLKKDSPAKIARLYAEAPPTEYTSNDLLEDLQRIYGLRHHIKIPLGGSNKK